MDKKTILVVDDEPQFIEVIKMRLESHGYSVVTASNGKECLKMIKTAWPSAVLLDIMMPEMNGFDALREVKKIDANLPVFMVTAFSDQEKFDEATKLGASGFIVKANDLGSEVENIIRVLNVADKFKTDISGDSNGR